MSDPYALKMVRNVSEAKRLDEQVDQTVANIGYLVHPTIMASLPENPHVADVATATGHFLKRFRELPSQAGREPVLHGYDISPAMFPSAAPAGITLTVNDIKEAPPAEMQGAYDLVNVRMLVAAMTADEWPTVMRNVVSLVKPGGWVQWTEFDAGGSKYLRGRPDSQIAAADKMAAIFKAALRSRFAHGWNTMHDDMRDAGLTNVIRDVVSSDRLPETRAGVTLNGFGAIFAFVRRTDVMSPEERERTEREAAANVESGCYVRFDIYVTCGQKPLQTGETRED